MAFPQRGLLEASVCVNFTDGVETTIGSCFPIIPFMPPPPPEKQSNHSLSPHVILIVAILVGSFFLLSYSIIIIKYRSRWNNTRRSPPQSDDTHEELEENQNPVHFIWYVNTVGLEESVINSIAVCKYKKNEGLIEGTECSVCLNEFHEDENLRLLPKCSHAFHLPCIDTWLKSHVNCPLCRANIVFPAASTSVAVPNTGASDEAGETQVENSESNTVSLGSDANRSNHLLEDEVELEDENIREDIDTAKGVFLAPLDCDLQMLGNLVDSHRPTECAVQNMDNGIQPVRRSVSLDSPTAAMICISVANLLPTGPEGSSSTTDSQSRDDDMNSNLGESSRPKAIIAKNGRNQGVLKLMPKWPSLQKQPVLMKRSFSSGAKFLLSRYGRNRSSVLPL